MGGVLIEETDHSVSIEPGVAPGNGVQCDTVCNREEEGWWAVERGLALGAGEGSSSEQLVLE